MTSHRVVYPSIFMKSCVEEQNVLHKANTSAFSQHIDRDIQMFAGYWKLLNWVKEKGEYKVLNFC